MEGKKRNLAILGSTGSIGKQTLQVVRALPDRFRILGLAAGTNTTLLAKQINEFRPRFVSSQDRKLKSSLAKTGGELLSPEEIASHPEVDAVIIATSGKAGLSPTLAAIRAGKCIALANKETLVMAGEIIMSEVRKNAAQILPLDSEHSAIWQCLNGERQKPAKLILTASGGPFLHYPAEQLTRVTPREALKHPSWRMGRRVTIDSATLMNKGLEVIEAHWLFDMPFENIKILIHPQSIIHSMVEFQDGSIKAQLSCPDMRLPIQYALSYPERLPNPQLPRISWDKIKSLSFEEPDYDSFPCLKLAIKAGENGGTCPAVLCAADEVAVELFLSGHIGFVGIASLVKRVLDQHKTQAHPSLEEIMAADNWAREATLKLAGEK